MPEQLGEIDPLEQELGRVVHDARALVRLASYRGEARESLVDGSVIYAPDADLTVEEFENDDFRATARVDIGHDGKAGDWQETRYLAQIEGRGKAADTDPKWLSSITVEVSRIDASGREIIRPYADISGARLARATMQAAINRIRTKLNGNIGQEESGTEVEKRRRFGHKFWPRRPRY